MASAESGRHLDVTIIERDTPKPKEKAPLLPLGRRVEQYIQSLPAFDRSIVTQATEQLTKHATPSFKNSKNEPNILITMPVAAHQEGAYIEQALEQYTKQEQAPAHEIILFCNWPTGADRTAVADTLQTIDRFMDRNPHLPVGYFMAEISPHTPIGAIRKHLADVALSRLEHSASKDDVLMLNHDADITKMNKRHLANLYEAFTQPDKKVTAVSPRTFHERGLRDAEGNLLFPNMDKVVAWHDFQAAKYGYELGYGISARGLMDIGGYDPNKREGETLNVLNRMYNGGTLNTLKHPERVRVPGAILVSSSRRHIYRMFADADSAIWDGDFSSTDHYRNEDVTQIPDITAEERDRIIKQSGLIRGAIYDKYFFYAQQNLSQIAAFDKAARETSLGLTFLESSKTLIEEFHRVKDSMRNSIDGVKPKE